MERLRHLVAEQEFRALKGGSRQDPNWSFLQEMRTLGHTAAERWLTENHAAVGSLVDLRSDPESLAELVDGTRLFAGYAESRMMFELLKKACENKDLSREGLQAAQLLR